MRLPMMGGIVAYRNQTDGRWYPAIIVSVIEDKETKFAKLGLHVFTLQDGTYGIAFVGYGNDVGEWQWPDMLPE